MITIFYSSRNNYEMLRDEVLPKLNFEGFKVINIDDNSSEEQKNLGRQICKDSNIPFIENTGRGIQWSINTAVNNVSTPYSVWLTHDVTPITANFFTKLSNFLSDNSSILEHQIGLFGFNLTWKPFTNEYSPNRAGCLGRSPLAKFPNPKANWYRQDLLAMEWENWKGIPAVECPCDMAVVVNNELFKKFITPTDNYHLFLALDDISLQFLSNNIYNVCLADFHIRHEQDLKVRFGIPHDSSGGAKSGDEYHFGKYGKHLEYWYERWGIDRNNKMLYNEYFLNTFKGTLLEKFFNHEVKNGPLKNFLYEI